MVDVEGIGQALAEHPESVRQIAFADHAILTRTDLCPPGDWPERLRALNPSIRVHDARDPGFDPARLLEPGSYAAFGKGEDVARWLAAESRADVAFHAGHGHDLNRHGAVQAVPLLREGPVPEARLRGFLERVTTTPGSGLLRIKGLVALQDDPARPAVVHAVGHRIYPLQRLDHWPDGVAESRLVVIGSALDAERLRRDFAALDGSAPALSGVLQGLIRR